MAPHLQMTFCVSWTMTKFFLLTLLDLSAAFDTLDHSVRFQRLEHLSGFSGTPLNWLWPYLSNKTRMLIISNKFSLPTMLNFGIHKVLSLGLPCSSCTQNLLLHSFDNALTSLLRTTFRYTILADQINLMPQSKACRIASRVCRHIDVSQ